MNFENKSEICQSLTHNQRMITNLFVTLTGDIVGLLLRTVVVIFPKPMVKWKKML